MRCLLSFFATLFVAASLEAKAQTTPAAPDLVQSDQATPLPPATAKDSALPSQVSDFENLGVETGLSQSEETEPERGASGVNMTNYPRDLSDQYSMVDRGIPIIQNPKACPDNGPNLRMTINNIDHDQGTIVADLHNDIVEDFLQSDKVVLRVRHTAKIGTINVCLPLPEPGQFAVAVYHDKNDNWKFDKGFLRIPREKFGMSNNPEFGLSTPEFSDVALTVPDTGADIIVNLVSAGDILKGNRK